MEINVLIIEDDPKAASLLEEVIKVMGYKVWLAENPKQGLELARNSPFAAIVTELRSPHMNGIEVTRAMRKISPEASVVVITAYSFINSAIEAMEVGAHSYITKPFNSSEIRIVLERAVERSLLLSSEVKKDYYVQLSVRDGLTSLYNYRYFKELLIYEFNRLARRPEEISVLMIDLDNFKKYNDTYGHPAGDELLQKLAKLLKNSVRNIDTVCRYGGEEFVIILPGTDKKGAEIVANRLLTATSLYLPMTLSIGVATCPADAEDPQGLVDKADQLLYTAKQTGKNKVCVA